MELYQPHRRSLFDDKQCIIEMHDEDTSHAISLAWALRDNGPKPVKAEVHRLKGLAILRDDGSVVHFRHPNCGYTGEGPRATASILETLRFGDAEMLYEKWLRRPLPFPHHLDTFYGFRPPDATLALN